MDQNQLTALAREYAEEATKADACDPNLSATDLNGIKHDVAEYAEEVISFLLRRFCLVEKRKIREAYKDAQKDQHNSEEDFALTLAGRNRSAVLIDLFPEIAKEVEG